MLKIKWYCGNKLGTQGWCAIFDALRDNTDAKIAKWDLEGQAINPKIAASLAAYLSVTKALKSLDLTRNQLCGIDMFGLGTYTAEGITKLCEGLKGSSVTSLECAAAPKAFATLSCQRPLTRKQTLCSSPPLSSLLPSTSLSFS